MKKLIAANKDIYSSLASLLHRLGIPCTLRGYRYIISAVIFVLENTRALDSVTKMLYPHIATLCETTSACVERDIRHAVGVSMRHGDLDVIDSLFGFSVNSNKGKPTNSEFISILAEYLYINIM